MCSVPKRVTIGTVENHRKGTLYRIRIRGVLSEMLLGAFPGLEAEARPDETVLVGTLADQAALYGVLGEIEALGLELLEVSRVPSGGGPQAVGTG